MIHLFYLALWLAYHKRCAQVKGYIKVELREILAEQRQAA